MTEADEDGGDADEFFTEADYESMIRPKMRPPLARRAGGIGVIDLGDIDRFLEGAAHRRVIRLMLLLALKDRASEVHFEPWRHEGADRGEVGLRVFYVVDGETHELVPPPACLTGFIFRDLREASGLGVPRQRIGDLLRRLASSIDGQPRPSRKGRFRLDHGAGQAHVEVTVHDSELGDRYFLSLFPSPEIRSDAAADEMRRQFEVMAERRRAERASGG